MGDYNDHKTRYVVAHNDTVSPQFNALLSPRTPAGRGWLWVRQIAHRFWVLEAIATILSLAIFMAILVILHFLNNSIYGDPAFVKKYKNKRPGIFPILAILSAIMRATMLLPVATAIGQLKWSWFRSARTLIDIERFDEAARGILGSAKLMFYLRFRNFATIGAALTILALPLDAVIQSAIRMPSKVERVDTLQATSSGFELYPVSTFINRSTSYVQWQTMTSPDDVWPQSSMVNAFQTGLAYSNGPSQIVDVTTHVDCPTGYCTFPKMQTLDIRHHCLLRNDVLDVPELSTDGQTYTYQTLPGTGLKLYVKGYNSTGGSVANQQIAAKSYFSSTSEDHDEEIFRYVSGPLIARTAMIINRYNITLEDVKERTYGIDCALFWDVTTTAGYMDSESNFTLAWKSENVQTRFSRDKRNRWIITPAKCLSKDNCNYWVSGNAHKGIQSMLNDTQFGLMGNLALLKSIPKSNGVWNRRNPFILNLDTATWGMTTEDALENVNSMWHNMAYFAGYTIRESPSYWMNGTMIDYLYVNGTVSALVTYYSIDWARLSMPAFIVLCCALFTVYTAVSTRKEYAWRRSALPLLFHGLEDHERHAQGDVRDFNTMQEAAKVIRVRLTEHVDEDGARLATQH